MTALGSRVSGRCDYGDSVTDCLLGSLVHNAPRTGNILVSTERDIEYADLVTLTIRDYPMNTCSDVFFSYAAAFTYLNQHELCFVGQSAIHAVAELSVTGSGNRRLCPVPLP
jgi:hypothetical protein